MSTGPYREPSTHHRVYGPTSLSVYRPNRPTSQRLLECLLLRHLLPRRVPTRELGTLECLPSVCLRVSTARSLHSGGYKPSQEQPQVVRDSVKGSIHHGSGSSFGQTLEGGGRDYRARKQTWLVARRARKPDALAYGRAVAGRKPTVSIKLQTGRQVRGEPNPLAIRNQIVPVASK